MKLKFILPYLFYLIINALFILKYASRQDYFNEYILVTVYFLVMLFIPYLYSKISFKNIFFKYSFLIIGTIFFAFTIYLNIMVDEESLNVDRWSAMHVGIEALLNGNYPYSATDHLGGRTSNLPTLIFIGIPFYLLGDVGYLQSFCFLIFTFIVYHIFDNYKDRLFCMLLLVLSPFYIWEIYVKSNLMSNFILILFFLFLFQHKAKNFKRISLLSFLSTALLLTRLIAVIPISLLLFKNFYYSSIKKKIKFVLIGLLTAILFIYICFQNVGSFEYFKKYNPLALQNRQLPLALSLITIIIPIIYSFYIDNFTHIANIKKK